jgi:hypothetical protein
MAVFGQTEKWIRVGKALEHIAGGPWESSTYSADRLLYEAVVDGEIRAKLGKALITDVTIITSKKWHETEKYALPFDLFVNCEDLYQKWDWSDYELADLITFGAISAGMATIMFETAILNLRTLLRQFHDRKRALGPEIARVELDFNSKWAGHMRECKLLLTVPGQNSEDLSLLENEMRSLETSGRNILGLQSAVPKKSKLGRREKYDWGKVESHIKELFLENGALTVEDKDWSSQADVERAIIEYCKQEFGSEPATSTARKRAKQMIEKFDDGRALSTN